MDRALHGCQAAEGWGVRREILLVVRGWHRQRLSRQPLWLRPPVGVPGRPVARTSCPAARRRRATRLPRKPHRAGDQRPEGLTAGLRPGSSTPVVDDRVLGASGLVGDLDPRTNGRQTTSELAAAHLRHHDVRQRVRETDRVALSRPACVTKPSNLPSRLPPPPTASVHASRHRSAGRRTPRCRRRRDRCAGRRAPRNQAP